VSKHTIKPEKEAKTMKRPDLLIVIAIWEFLSALGSLIGVVAILIFAFPGISPYAGPPDPGTIFGLGIAILFLLGGAGIAVAGGIGLILGQEWGRILTMVHSVLSLFAIPCGTVIGILVLIYLMKPETREYFERSRE
jgi:hypothetical protein